MSLLWTWVPCTWCVDLKNCNTVSVEFSFEYVLPYLLICFDLKPILSDIKMATSTFFLGPFAWNTFFHPFTLRRYLSLMLQYVSWIQQKDGSCVCIHSVSLCLFTGGIDTIDFERYHWAARLHYFVVTVEVAVVVCASVYWLVLSQLDTKLESSERKEPQLRKCLHENPAVRHCLN